MSELYWITRATAFNTIFILILVLSLITFVVSLIAWCANKSCEVSASEYHKDEYRGYVKLCKKVMKSSSIVAILGMLGFALVPSTEEALLIYGVGGTIDYLKENPTAKQLPDKCINALDKWVDSWNYNDSTKVD